MALSRSIAKGDSVEKVAMIVNGRSGQGRRRGVDGENEDATGGVVNCSGVAWGQRVADG